MMMRCIFAFMVFVAAPAHAQDAGEFAAKVQEEYGKAKNADEVASITAYCKAKIGSFSFKERDALSVRAIKLLEANKTEEANVLFRKVDSIEELDETLGKMICKKK